MNSIEKECTHRKCFESCSKVLSLARKRDEDELHTHTRGKIEGADRTMWRTTHNICIVEKWRCYWSSVDCRLIPCTRSQSPPSNRTMHPLTRVLLRQPATNIYHHPTLNHKDIHRPWPQYQRTCPRVFLTTHYGNTMECSRWWVQRRRDCYSSSMVIATVPTWHSPSTCVYSHSRTKLPKWIAYPSSLGIYCQIRR